MKHFKYLFIPLLFLNSIMASNPEDDFHVLLDNTDNKTIEDRKGGNGVDLVTSPIRTSLRERKENNGCTSACKECAGKTCCLVTFVSVVGVGTWYGLDEFTGVSDFGKGIVTFVTSGLTLILSGLYLDKKNECDWTMCLD